MALMAVAGGTMPANMVRLNQDGIPVVKHRENRPAEVLKSVEEAESLLRSGLHAWVPSSAYMQLLDRMSPQGALVDVPKSSNGKRPTYLQLDDTKAAEGPPAYDPRTCAQRHDDEFKALKMEVELLGRRLAKIEGKLAQEQCIREALQLKLDKWEADS